MLSSTHLSVFPAQGFICRRSHFLWQPLLLPPPPPPPHTVRSLTATQWAALRRGAAGRAVLPPPDESGEMLPPVGRVKRRQQLIIEFSVGRDLKKKMFWVKVGFFLEARSD